MTEIAKHLWIHSQTSIAATLLLSWYQVSNNDLYILTIFQCGHLQGHIYINLGKAYFRLENDSGTRRKAIIRGPGIV